MWWMFFLYKNKKDWAEGSPRSHFINYHPAGLPPFANILAIAAVASGRW
jgi:hypothetical protein